MKVPFVFIQKMCQALSSSIQVLIREDKLNPSMDFKTYFCLWKAKLERDYSFRVQFDKITVCLACIWCSSRCLMRVPPTLWTMHFGLPVVPDEYMINSGWSNETCKKSKKMSSYMNYGHVADYYFSSFLLIYIYI